MLLRAGKLATLALSTITLLAADASDDGGGIPDPPPILTPEPATWQMLALATAAGLGVGKWRRKRR